MKAYTIFRISALFLTALLLFNSCGISIDVAKRHHQPGLYVNISNDRQAPSDKMLDIEITEAETREIKPAQLRENTLTAENLQGSYEKHSITKPADEHTPKSTEASKAITNHPPSFADQGGMVPPGKISAGNVDANVVQTSGGGSGKSQLAALLLGLLSLFVLVGFGLHRFYLGYTRIAIWQLVLTLVGLALAFIYVGLVLLAIVWIWTLIDVIRILNGSLQPKGGRYSRTI